MRPDPITGIIIGFLFFQICVAIAGAYQMMPVLGGAIWLLLVGTAVFWIHRRSSKLSAIVGLRPFRVDRISWMAVPLTVVFGLGVSGIVSSLWGPINFPLPLPEGSSLEAYLATPGGLVVFALYAVSVGPLVEEFAFRGWIQRSVERRAGPIVAITVSSICFAVPHFWYSSNFALLVPLVLGVVFGTAASLTRSVWAGFVLHASWNGALMLIVAAGVDTGAILRWSEPIGLFIAASMAIVSSVMLGALFYRYQAVSAHKTPRSPTPRPRTAHPPAPASR